jgi:RNA polymerase sigma factor (TIGR02999 family)
MDKDLTGVLNELDSAPDAIEKALPLVYKELRAIAAVQLRQERAGHTFLTTDLVHEAYLRLFDGSPSRFNDKRHFFATAALAMRRILVDHARKKNAAKRMDPDAGIPAVERPELGPQLSIAEVLDLDIALELLESLDERQSQIVHLRVFAGLTGKETAELMSLSERTVAREWFSAKAWLREQVGQ